MVASLSAALERAGVKQLRVQLLITALQFSREEWIAIYDEATKRTLSEGQIPGVREVQWTSADAQPPKPDEGQVSCVLAGRPSSAGVRSPMPEGQAISAREGQHNSADGLPIASGEASSRLPAKATYDVPPIFIVVHSATWKSAC